MAASLYFLTTSLLSFTGHEVVEAVVALPCVSFTEDQEASVMCNLRLIQLLIAWCDAVPAVRQTLQEQLFLLAFLSRRLWP